MNQIYGIIYFVYTTFYNNFYCVYGLIFSSNLTKLIVMTLRIQNQYTLRLFVIRPYHNYN